MDDAETKSPEEFWNALDEMEVLARGSLLKQLKPFEHAFQSCYAAGVQVITLPSETDLSPDLSLAAPFLKRALNDLRAVWVLLLQGATSQAACVAAGLYENALAATLVVRSPQAALELRKSKDGDLPWGPQELAKRVAEHWYADQQKTEENSHYRKEKLWRNAYAGYKWLCKIKHPTLPSVCHDSVSTAVNMNTYVVMALPDIRESDLPVKATVALISLSRSCEMIRSFALAMDLSSGTELDDFCKRLKVAFRETHSAYSSLMKESLPFDISATAFAQQSKSILCKKRNIK